MKPHGAESPQYIRAILDSLDDRVAVVDSYGNIVAVNDAWESFAAQNAAAGTSKLSVGANYLEVCRRASKAGNVAAEPALFAIQSVLDGAKERVAMDYECSSPEQERWFRVNVIRHRTGDGAIIVHSDVTESRAREEALRRSEQRLRLLTDAIPVLVSYVDESQVYRFNNKSYEQWFGHSREYVQGNHLRQVLGEKAYQAIRPKVEAALSGQEVTFEDFIPYRGAGRRYVRVTYIPDRQNGRTKGFFALIQDLTERKQAEEAIRESRDKLSTVIAGADVGLWDWNIQAGTVEVNERLSSMLGYSADGFGNDVQRFFDSVYPEDLAKATRLTEDHFAGKTDFYSCDLRLRVADGSYKWIHDAGRLIERDHKASPLRMVGIFLDINDRKLADEALKAGEEEFRSMFELAAVGNAQADPETGRFIRVNRKFCEITGYTEAELLNMTYPDITYPEDRARDAAEVQRVVKGQAGAWSREKRYIRKDGKVIWVSVNGAAIRVNGSARCTVANILDITERKSDEQALREHREALRNLAADISQTQENERRQIADDLHDHIGQNLILAKMKLGELKALLPQQHSPSIEQIRSLLDQSIEDTRSLIRDLCPQVLYELGLEAAIDWLVEHTQEKYDLRCFAEIARLRKPLSEDRRVILFQAARELLVNVAKHARAKEVRVSLRGDQTRVTIEVTDDGRGFNSSLLTFPSSTARGFGLFSIRERLGLLGGELRIESAPERGTRATVTIPA